MHIFSSFRRTFSLVQNRPALFPRNNLGLGNLVSKQSKGIIISGAVLTVASPSMPPPTPHCRRINSTVRPDTFLALKYYAGPISTELFCLFSRETIRLVDSSPPGCDADYYCWASSTNCNANCYGRVLCPALDWMQYEWRWTG